MSAGDGREAPGDTGADERLYAGLLRLYPVEFRRSYADEMVRLFGDQLRDARASHRPGRIATTWFRSLIDLVANAVGEHLRRDRRMAQSLSTFEPTRSIRLLGLLGVAGGVVLLWAFIALNPFGDRSVNFVRLAIFSLGGIAIALALHDRLTPASPRLAGFVTAGVLVIGVWNIVWAAVAIGQDNPYADAFGGVGIVGAWAGWIVQAIYGAVLLRLAGATPGITNRARTVIRIAALALVVGGPLAFFGTNDRELANWQDNGWIFTTIGQIGLILTGVGWIALGALLVFAGRRARLAPGR